MKTIKKITILALMMILIGLTFANTTNAVVADLQNKVYVSSTSGRINQEVTISITAKGDILLDNDSLLLEFNKEKLEYVKSTMATVPNTMIIGGNRVNHEAGPDGFAIALTSTVADKATMPNGTIIAQITFKILEGTTENQVLNLVHYANNTRTLLSFGEIAIIEDSDNNNNNDNNNNDNNDNTDNNDNNNQEQPKISYEIIEGKDSKWSIGKGGNLVFRSSGNFADFVNVSIDDKTLDKSYYTAKSGSTIVEIKEAYLKRLNKGTHKISINFKEGSATANFIIEETEKVKPDTLPDTGAGNIYLIIAFEIVLILNIGISLIIYYKKKKTRV